MGFISKWIYSLTVVNLGKYTYWNINDWIRLICNKKL